MTQEEFIELHCKMCGTQRCYGIEYCGLYKRYVLGEHDPLDEIIWAAKQQLVIQKLSEDNKTETGPHWIKVPTGKLIEDPDRIHWECSVCGKKTDLPNYEKANYCFNCGAKMLREDI